jgi:hypothetical protein
MKWRNEAPTVDGLYFYRPIGGPRAVAQVHNGMIEFPVVGNVTVALALAVFNWVQWAGPIAEPDDEV